MKKFIEYDWKRAVQFLVHSSKTRKYNAKKEIKGKFLKFINTAVIKWVVVFACLCLRPWPL